jgi:hypothetical protein
MDKSFLLLCVDEHVALQEVASMNEADFDSKLCWLQITALASALLLCANYMTS